MDLLTRDLKHNWHPCIQMKDCETFPPVIVKHAFGSYLELENGQKIIDAISSWWCKSLGHDHPRLKQALLRQIDTLGHTIFANTTNETIVQLSEQLATLLPPLNKVLYASDGSCAVEMAMKLSIHSRQILGQHDRQLFASLTNSYHGETGLCLAVSDLGIYRKPYEAILIKPVFIEHIPYVSSMQDPLWQDAESHWKKIETQLEPYKEKLTAILVEPILQGASGMQIYSQDFLKRLRIWTKQHGIHLIADEIMTGFGRTGKMLACHHADITPDFLCLGKGLTAGWLPMSATLTSQDIYDIFYDDYEAGKSFLHSHTHSGNPLSAAVALETMKVLQQENILQMVEKNSSILAKKMKWVEEQTGKIKNVRHIGMVAACDLDTTQKRGGFLVFQQAMKLGALLRPLGNTIYWLPPLNTSEETIEELAIITKNALERTEL